jgi:hypothetical protein
MTDQSEEKPKKKTPQKSGIQIDAPGFQGEVSEETAKSFLAYTGESWQWVVKAIAWAVFFGGTCWGLSCLIH